MITIKKNNKYRKNGVKVIKSTIIVASLNQKYLIVSTYASPNIKWTIKLFVSVIL